MNETVSQGRGPGQQPDAPASEETNQTPPTGGLETGANAPHRGRVRWVAVGTVAVLVVGGVVSAWYAGAFSPASSSGNGQGALPGYCPPSVPPVCHPRKHSGLCE